MQRAAREREEDAAAAASRAEASASAAREFEAKMKKRRRKDGLFGLAPQPCETSYDCDHPMVCCDLLVASVCCDGGMLIPRTDGVEGLMQRQRAAIPVPVERDSPFPGAPPGSGVAPPQYPGNDGGVGGL